MRPTPIYYSMELGTLLIHYIPQLLVDALPSSSAFLLSFRAFSLFTIRIRHHRSHSEHEQFRIVSHVSIPPSPAPEASVAGPRYSIFNVLDFGAIGDGVIDDTQAFKQAWDMACQIESVVTLVPDGYSFMLQSTIFAGPCKTVGLVFQVMNILPFPYNIELTM
ncbi:hypothetical protein V6N12_075372 [Hibiscus sabdariffa]|uniref:Polygalacturonase n=1 Tax=Hibiscus sabdariffa TaxID=183260 RepID=A0ABR2C7E9_9ROSI